MRANLTETRTRNGTDRQMCQPSARPWMVMTGVTLVMSVKRAALLINFAFVIVSVTAEGQDLSSFSHSI